MKRAKGHEVQRSTVAPHPERATAGTFFGNSCRLSVDQAVMKPLVRFALGIAVLHLLGACGEAPVGAERDRDPELASPGSNDLLCEEDADCDDGLDENGPERCWGGACTRSPVVRCSGDVCEFVEAGRADESKIEATRSRSDRP